MALQWLGRIRMAPGSTGSRLPAGERPTGDRMRRRDFFAALVLAAAAGLARARAQGPPKQPRIALVHSGIPAEGLTETGGVPWVREFFQELRRLGYADGRNLVVERYSAEGHLDRLADL